MARLPVVGSDSDAYGTILNAFLGVEHNSDGTHPVLYDRGGALFNAKGYATVAAAVTAGGAGSTVYLPPGTYTSSPFSLAVNQRLTGAPGATLKLANASNADFISIISAPGASIDTITIDANKANQTVAGAAIVVSSSDNVSIDKVHVKNAKGRGIVSYLGNNVQISHCLVETSGTVGQATDGTGSNILIYGTTDVRITNNRCIGGEDTSILLAAGGAARRVLIDGNQVSGAKFIGIGTGGGLANNQDVTVTNNHVRDCISNGIDFGNSQQVIITSNRVHNCGGGIIADTSALTGPYANHGNVIIDTNIITACTNAASGSLHGIAVVGFATVTNNHVSGCVAGAGIYLGPGPTNAKRTDIKVRGNTCWNNKNYGIQLVAAATDVVSDVFITENRCYDDQATKTQYYGLTFYIVTGGAVDYVKIINNNLRGNTVSKTLTEGPGTVGVNVTDTGNFV